MKLRRQPLAPLAVQLAVVCTALVVGLLPLTAPLPPMSRSAAVVSSIAGLVLISSVAALGAVLLVPRWFRMRSTALVVSAAALGSASAIAVYLNTADLLTRPLLLVTAASLFLVGAATVRRAG